MSGGGMRPGASTSLYDAAFDRDRASHCLSCGAWLGGAGRRGRLLGRRRLSRGLCISRGAYGNHACEATSEKSAIHCCLLRFPFCFVSRLGFNGCNEGAIEATRVKRRPNLCRKRLHYFYAAIVSPHRFTSLLSGAAVAAVMAFGARAEPPAAAAAPQASSATIRYVPDDLRDDSWLQALKAAQIKAIAGVSAFHDFQFTDRVKRAASPSGTASWTTRARRTKRRITTTATASRSQTSTATA